MVMDVLVSNRKIFGLSWLEDEFRSQGCLHVFSNLPKVQAQY